MANYRSMDELSAQYADLPVPTEKLRKMILHLCTLNTRAVTTQFRAAARHLVNDGICNDDRAQELVEENTTPKALMENDLARRNMADFASKIPLDQEQSTTVGALAEALHQWRTGNPIVAERETLVNIAALIAFLAKRNRAPHNERMSDPTSILQSILQFLDTAGESTPSP